MKNYSTPAMTALNVNVENAILAGSEPVDFPGGGAGSITYTWWPQGQGNGKGYTFGYVNGKWVDGNGKTADSYGFDSSNWLSEILN